MSDATVVESWLAGLTEGATWERVRDDFWYVRIPGQARRWIPIELSLGPRTLKATSHVIPEPDENHAEVYAYLLRYNHSVRGVAFSIDGKEGVLCLVGRIPRAQVSAETLDSMAGAIVETTEATFRSILQLGFATRLARRAP